MKTDYTPGDAVMQPRRRLAPQACRPARRGAPDGIAGGGLRLERLLALLSIALAPALAAAAAPALPDAAPVDPLATQALSRAIAASEYDMRMRAAANCALPGHEATDVLQAPNRAHDLRACFTATGMHVVPRTATRQDAHEAVAGATGTASPRWRWGLALLDYGSASARRPSEPTEPVAAGNRVEYRRGPLTEWYINSPAGLEQGFTLHAPLSDTGATVLRIGFPGDLRPAADGEAVVFRAGDGAQVLRYGKLVAFDADGRTLPARMSLAGADLEIEVQTAGARYPVTVDPLATSETWTAESDQSGAQFGSAVATAGDVDGDGYSDILVGAPFFDAGQSNEGRVFLYRGGPDGPSSTPDWTAESDQAGAGFGNSVATAGDVNGDGYADVIIGASSFSAGQTGEGRAFVYLGGPTGLAATPAWTAESNQANASFAFAVAAAGDVNGDGYGDVIVGAPLFDAGQTNEGRAFVYLGSASGLAASPAWTAESNQAEAFFGRTLGTAGDVNGDGYADVIIGAFLFDNGQNGEGRAFVYHGGPTGLAASAAWTAESNQADAGFGSSVATAGDVNGDGYADVLVGALNFDNGQIDEGAVFVYYGSATGLPASATWLIERNRAGARFGSAVAPAGDVNGDGYADILVGAELWNGGEAFEGGAFVYLGRIGTPTLAWQAEGNQINAAFGRAVAGAGDVNGDGYADVLVGALRFDAGQSDEGRAFLYPGGASATALSSFEGWSIEEHTANAALGRTVAAAGDVNGDGFADFAVSVPGAGGGRVQVYHGSSARLRTFNRSNPPSWTASPAGAAGFGGAVAGAGDVNGDGYGDLIVGEPGHDGDRGRVHVYHGGPAGLAASAAWTADGAQPGALFGGAVAGAGDVNGDGYADVIVAAHLHDGAAIDEGRTYVYLGGPAGLAITAAWSATSGEGFARFGESVASAGDVNGDGYADVIVGGPLSANGEAGEGRAFVYLGSPAGLALSPAWTAESNQANAELGGAVAGAGDVNGDGYADVLIGGRGFDDGQLDEGRAWLYLGGAAGLAAVPAWTDEGDSAGALFGSAVASAGDVNGDGYSDVLVGWEGAELVRAYLGNANGLEAASMPWAPEVGGPDTGVGSAVTGVGDVNGDGYADVLIGAPDSAGEDVFTGASFSRAGRASMYLGNDGLNRWTVRLRQRSAANDAPLALGNRLPGTAFTVVTDARGEFGRGRIKLEWEVKPLGALLDGTGLQRSISWTDSGTAGVTLTALVDALSFDDTPYKWRVRVLHDPATTPLARHGRWLTPAANGQQEPDLRSPVLDTDGDGLRDSLEVAGCTSPFDVDSDDDGLADGVEDANRNGAVDAGETDPCNADSDGDGIQDGTEVGVTIGVPDPDGSGPLLGTDLASFIPDADPGTTTDPFAADTDGDGQSDGEEDVNRNGAVDPGESDPNEVLSSSAPMQVPLPAGALLLLAGLLAGAARYQAGRARAPDSAALRPGDDA